MSKNNKTLFLNNGTEANLLFIDRFHRGVYEFNFHGKMKKAVLIDGEILYSMDLAGNPQYKLSNDLQPKINKVAFSIPVAVYIEVIGGVVTSVRSNKDKEEVKVYIVDRDNLQDETDPLAIAMAEHIDFMRDGCEEVIVWNK